MSLDTPFICDLHALRLSKEPEHLRRVLFRRFGDIYSSLDERASDIIKIYDSNIPTDIKKEWISFISEEILLAQIDGKVIPGSLLDIFSSLRPLGDSCPALGTLLKLEKACSTFPLKTDESPSSARIWIFKADTKSKCQFSDISESLDGFDDIFSKGANLFPILVPETEGKFYGKSWQLAASIAIKAIGEGNPKHLRSLALDWIATGTCDGERTGYVELGNKLSLNFGRHRSWIIPRENVKEIPPALHNMFIRSANTLDDAWNTIIGKSHKEGYPLKWSEMSKKCEELHITFGGDIKAAVMSVLLLKPKTIVPWLSESDMSKKSFENFRQVIDSLHFKSIIHEHTEKTVISSSDLHLSEKRLMAHFEGKPSIYVIFNITSGNRLMSYAVQSVARLYPNVHLIYREAESPQGQFVYFNYHDFPPYSGIITANNLPPTKHNWEYLSSNKKEDRFKNGEEFLRRLKIRKDHRSPPK